MPYLGFEPTASDTLSVFKYVATSSQTTFTGADANGATLSYDVGDGSCQVWLNGVRLDSSDITATNSTSVVLAACTAGDIVHVQATSAFIPADVVPKAAGGTFGGAVVAPSLTLSSTPLPVASGGSGAATHSANGVLLGAGTGALTTAAPGSSGNLLTSNGTVWASAAPAAAGTEITDHFFVNGSAAANVTGDGTVYVPVFTASENYDPGGVFTTSTYTASAAGKLCAWFCFEIGPFASDHNRLMIKMITTNRDYTALDVSPYNVAAVHHYNRWTGSFIANMSSGHTATFYIYCDGGSKVLDISAGNTTYPDHSFGGFLIKD
jgi:hypothetical protein